MHSGKSPRAWESLGDRRTAGIRRAAVWNASMEWKPCLCLGGRLLSPSKQSWKNGVEGDKGRWGDRGYITKGFCTLSSRWGWDHWQKSWCERRRVRGSEQCGYRGWEDKPRVMLLHHRKVTVQEGDGASRKAASSWPCMGTALHHSQTIEILASAPLQPQPAETSSPAVRGPFLDLHWCHFFIGLWRQLPGAGTFPCHFTMWFGAPCLSSPSLVILRCEMGMIITVFVP